MNTRRKDQLCPKCEGELMLEDGIIKCTSCDYEQVDRRKLPERGVDGW